MPPQDSGPVTQPDSWLCFRQVPTEGKRYLGSLQSSRFCGTHLQDPWVPLIFPGFGQDWVYGH